MKLANDCKELMQQTELSCNASHTSW